MTAVPPDDRGHRIDLTTTWRDKTAAPAFYVRSAVNRFPHLRDTTTGRAHMDIGYDRPLYILPFDHRSWFEKGLFGFSRR
jgi:hypothetical protein